MSLEDAVNRAAAAIERNDNLAVKEIIRQRDEAIKQRDRWERDADYYMKDRNDLSKRLRNSQNRINSLRGVITRMKNARKLKEYGTEK